MKQMRGANESEESVKHPARHESGVRNNGSIISYVELKFR